MKHTAVFIVIFGFSFVVAGQQKSPSPTPELKSMEVSQGEKAHYPEAQLTPSPVELKSESTQGGVRNKEAVLQIREEKKVTPKAELKAIEGPK